MSGSEQRRQLRCMVGGLACLESGEVLVEHLLQEHLAPVRRHRSGAALLQPQQQPPGTDRQWPLHVAGLERFQGLLQVNIQAAEPPRPHQP